MEYQKIKKSIFDFSKDLINRPILTISICVIVITLYLLSIIIPNYVTSVFITSPKVNNEVLKISLPEVAITSSGQKIDKSINVQYISDKGVNSRGEPYSVKVSYPKFEIKKLDDKIEELINAHVILAKYGDSDIQSHFIGDFEQPYIDPKIISLEVNLSHFGNDKFMNQGRPFETIIGISYDRINDKIYSIDDLSTLTGLPLQKISSVVSTKLTEGNSGQKIELEPIAKNFSNFVINKDEVIFIFQRYQILSGAAGTPRIGVKRI